MKPSHSCALLLATLCSDSVFSAPENSSNKLASEVSELGHYVITGTRTHKLLVDSPVKVQLVTQEDIQLKNARDLKEAVEDVPGIMLRKVHGKSGYEVSMQGIDAKRVLVLIDGERVARSSNGITDLSQIGVSNIEQIEIVKGATSALYGSNAIGGVINVITSIPSQAFSYSLKADLGSHFDQNLDENDLEISTASSAGSFSWLRGKWDAAVNYDVRDTEGFELDPKAWKHEGDDKSKFNSTFTLGFNPDISQRYFASAEYYDESVSSQFYGTGPNRSLYRKEENASRYTYKAGYDVQSTELGQFKLRYFYEEMEDITSQDVVTTSGLEQKRQNTSSEQKLTLQWDMDVEGGSLRTVGIEITPETAEQNKWSLNNDGEYSHLAEVPKQDALRKEFYFQDDFYIGERLELLPGIRAQHDSDFGQYVTPKINGRFEVSQTDTSTSHIRFGIGRGYRVPSLKDRHFNFDHSQHGYKVIGNPDLTPEYSDSFQLGWVHTFDEGNLVDLNLFRNHLQDFIEALPSYIEPNGVQVYEYGNIAKARTQGLELISQYRLNDELKLNTGYTFQKAIDRETGNWLPKIPRHLIKASLTYKPTGNFLSLQASAKWEGKSYFDTTRASLSKSFSTFDLRANFNLSKGLTIYTGIDNITNTQKDFSKHFDLRPEEGRYAYIGLRVEN